MSQAPRGYGKQEELTAQKLFETQDKRVRGGYEDAISSLRNDSNHFMAGLADLKTRIKGLSAYPQLAKPNNLGY